MPHRLFYILTICLFFIVILFPLFGQVIGINSQTDNTEYRKLSKTPFPEDAPLISIPKNINEYFNDNFGFRNTFIKIYGYIKLNIFNTHPLNSVNLGKNGWIFMNPMVFPTPETWYKTADFTKEQLQEITDFLEAERRWLNERGIIYIVEIVPYKEHVYSNEYLYPNHIVSKPLLEHFITAIKQNTKVNLVDLRQPLIQAKLDYPVYYHTDSHWNQWGAFIGYQEIGKIITKEYPNFHLFIPTDFEIKPEYYHNWTGDLMRTSAIWKNRVPEVGVKLNLKSVLLDKYPKLETIFVYGDSFADSQHYASKEDFLEQFPQLKDKLDLIFIEMPDGKSLKIKSQIDELIPVIQQNISDQDLVKKVIRYLINFRLLDDETIGINYFLNLNFKNIHFEQRQTPIEKELIEKEQPQVVVREIIEQVLYSTFDELSKTRF